MPPRKRGVGRPSLGTSARSVAIQVKFSPREVAAIKAAVKAENAELKKDHAERPLLPEDRAPTTISSWIRDHALDPLGLMPRSSEDS